MHTSKDLAGSCFTFKGILEKIRRGKFCSCFKASAEGSVSFVVLFVFSKALVCETPGEREREREISVAKEYIYIYSYNGICFCIVCVMTSVCFCFKSKTTEHSESLSFN